MSEPYLTPEQKVRQRHSWFLEANRLGNVRLACLRLGISHKTFYKWRRRFREAQGDRSALLDSLPSSLSSNPPGQKGPDPPHPGSSGEDPSGTLEVAAAVVEPGSQEDPLRLHPQQDPEAGGPDAYTTSWFGQVTKVWPGSQAKTEDGGDIGGWRGHCSRKMGR